MAPRAYWKGYLRLSLVSCPIQLFPAISDREKVRFHLINKNTGHRIKYCKLDAETGKQVESQDIVMGYEVGGGQYVALTEDELKTIGIEGTHTIEIDQFVPRNEIDDLYLSRPYYMTPAGEIGRQAYGVIREAIRKEGMVALGRVVLTTREHVMAIEPHGKGLVGVTLRYPYEIRDEKDYFGDLPEEGVPREMLELGRKILAMKAGHFHPEQFEDHYERALRALIKRKQRGEKIDKPKKRPSAEVIDLMDALRQSAADGRSTPLAPHQRVTRRFKQVAAKRSSIRARKAS
ncbi:Ku protein [Bradyrhizobium brasilense]|uniref:non-homologous end joining protein Ku n=1 Tax=Bradyrhizobium brasilense TaxID=1419277 RepID=UPI0024B14186|nr:Ku protein [Bradyrhizobium australafricanum]WFU34341.1 Ku protein [Bradyrhizobium australafricanum]